MRLLFIIPWPLEDPLSRATVLPHLAALAADPQVEAILLLAPLPAPLPGLPAPHAVSVTGLLPDRVSAVGLPLRRPGLPLLARVVHHQRCSQLLLREAQRFRPQLCICRGTSAIHGALLQHRLAIPFVAESFEPHAEYMRQTGTWSRWDPKYRIQRRWEARVKRSAAALITVSLGYARHLRDRDGLPAERLYTVPCWVDGQRFRIDAEARARLRRHLGIADRLALVYAGKFGGIYSPLDELAILRQLQQDLGQPLFVIVLTSAAAAAVRQQLELAGFGPEQTFVACVPHGQVGDYLNAADLAVSFINSGPWSFACSAIKHGEYWACGLPVLMPPGVGDEAGWLEAERAGAFARFQEPDELRQAAGVLRSILAEPGHRQRIRAIALRERSAAPMTLTYRRLLEAFLTPSPPAS